MATCAVLTLVLAFPPYAGAATYDYSISGATGHGGSGVSSGEILYGATRSRVSIIYGSLDDVCPADGKGVQLRLRTRNATGGAVDWAIATDTRDCPPGPLSSSFPVAYNAPWNIAESRAELWATEGGSPIARFSTSAWKPYAP
jgi:hypothetical protein